MFQSAMIVSMTDVTRILNHIEQGDSAASEQLLPIVYKELRILARQRLANEKPGQTLQATALVHEAYLRRVGNDKDQVWDNRGHLFGAAAEAMRRILINRAKHKKRQKRGGDWTQKDFAKIEDALNAPDDVLLEIDEVLEEFTVQDKQCADLVKLRFFGGLSLNESADCLGISQRTAYRYWNFAQAWLLQRLKNSDSEKN